MPGWVWGSETCEDQTKTELALVTKSAASGVSDPPANIVLDAVVSTEVVSPVSAILRYILDSL